MAGDPLKKGRYTNFGNKIGLFSNKTGNFISNSPEVVLNFPFKDTVLEAGMAKEDSGREERFLHIEMDAKDIDTLEDPKVLTNFKYIDRSGEHALDENSDIEFFDENGELKQNLLIKGNNLLALHTLKEKLAGKVKLIYIDPPYNTGSDGFKYNDSFNHSSWLVFMKNRLEIAKDLLSESGAIFISCDDNEQAYLKVLCDEIFNRDNFLSDIIWNSTKSVTNTAIISVSHTHNLCYFKNRQWWVEHRTDFRLREDGVGFSNPDNDPRGPWKADPFQVGGWRPNQQYEIINPNTGVKYRPNPGCSWKNDFEHFKVLLKENRIVFGTNGDASPQRKRFLSEALDRGKVAKTIWDDIDTTTNATKHNKELFGKSTFSNPKPESLIERIIELATNEGDIVLDYHLGSGTTSAAALKMNRRWIGIEQMDYIETVSKERLKKVISGEQGGISKDVNWQGGGSFVYFELKKYNQDFIDRIMEAITIPELEEIYQDMQKNAFLKFWFDKKEFERDENFRSLSLDERKQKLVDILDENQFYLNYAEMNDAKYHVSDAEKVLTDRFYQTNEESEDVEE